MQFASAINNEAEIAKVPPCALAAIVARETGGQNILQYGADPATGLLPDGSTAGVGLCQITAGVDWSDPAHPKYKGYDLWNPADNLYVAAAWFLAPAIATATRLQRDYPATFARFGDGQILFWAFAAYNAGDGWIEEAASQGRNPDNGTTDGYAADAYSKYLAFVQASEGGS